MFSYSVDKRTVSIDKYQGDATDKYYGILYENTMNQWDKDELSLPALGILLHLTSGIAPNRDWSLRVEDLCCSFVKNPQEFEKGLQELEEKGYAAERDGVIYLRNDKRKDWRIPAKKTGSALDEFNEVRWGK